MRHLSVFGLMSDLALRKRSHTQYAGTGKGRVSEVRRDIIIALISPTLERALFLMHKHVYRPVFVCLPA